MVNKMSRQKCSFGWLYLNHSKPEDFTRCHWQEANRVLKSWVAYRVCLAAYFVITFLYHFSTFTDDKPGEHIMKFFIFSTHWTYFLQCVLFFVAFIVVVIKYVQEKKAKDQIQEMESMPRYYKLYWVLYTAALPGSISVSIIFWTMLYDPVLFPSIADNLLDHTINCLLMFIDFFVVSIPLQYTHFYIPTAYALAYSIFSYIYYASGGTGTEGKIPIYSILNWKHPTRAVLTCFLSIVLLLSIFCTFVALQNLKKWLLTKKVNKLKKKSSLEDQQA